MKRNRFLLSSISGAILLALAGCTAQSDPIRQVDTTELPLITAAATASPEPLSISVQASVSATASAIPAPAATPKPTDAPTKAPTATPTAEPTATPAPTPEPDMDEIERFLAAATAMEGKPYLKGGTTEEGFDPGGFVYYCLQKIGLKVSHKSSKGYSEQENWTKIDDLDDAAAGDLLFFRTGTNENVNCVCICLGDGTMIYPSSSKGEVVITKIHTSYWKEAFVFARRVLE